MASTFESTGGGGGGIAELAEDTSPVLGGALNANNFQITKLDSVYMKPAGTPSVQSAVRGIEFSGSNYIELVWPMSITGNHSINVPAASGTIALTSDIAAGVWVDLGAETITNASNVEWYSNDILDTYKMIKFVFIDLVPETDNTDFWVRLGTSNGGTVYSTDEYDYESGGAITQDAAQIVLSAGNGNDTGETICGEMILIGHGNAASFTKIQGNIMADNAAGTGVVTTRTTARDDTVRAHDFVRFLMSSGNIASGTIKAYGLT